MIFSLPYLLSYLLQTLYGMADLYIIGQFGSVADSSAVSIGSQVTHMLMVMIVGLAMGAQNIGANKPERAVATLRYAAFLAAGFGCVVAVVIQFFAEPVVSLFTDATTAEGAEVVRLGRQYLRGYVWDCIFAGVHFCFSGYFCAVGKSGISFMHNIIAIVLMRVSGVHLTSKLFPATLFPMGLATASGSVISVIICVIAFTILMKKSKQNEFEVQHG